MAIISHKVEGVANDVTHYARVYPVNKKGHAQSELDGQIASALTNAFPAEPTSYALIGTYSSSQTFVAPEDGYYQIELFGRSGKGGNGAVRSIGTGSYGQTSVFAAASGGGGGSGAYSCSRIKLNKGDLVLIDIDADCSVTVNPTTDELYDVMKCTTGSDGTDGVVAQYTPETYTPYNYKGTGGVGGVGGVATGGNAENINGKSGSNGSGTGTNPKQSVNTTITTHGVSQTFYSGGSGGSAVIADGNSGGNGGSTTGTTYKQGSVTGWSGLVGNSGNPAKAGFCKIYRGNTNVA